MPFFIHLENLSNKQQLLLLHTCRHLKCYSRTLIIQTRWDQTIVRKIKCLDYQKYEYYFFLQKEIVQQCFLKFVHHKTVVKSGANTIHCTWLTN